MKVTQLLNEGMYVVKNRDGVEKRFKSADSADAKAWKDSSSAKPTKVKVDRTAQVDKANQLVWRAISEIDGFGELDWSDLVRMKVLPRLTKALRELPDAYPEALHDAVAEARGNWGTYDRLIKFFDKAVKAYGREKSWNSYVKSMESFSKDQG